MKDNITDIELPEERIPGATATITAGELQRYAGGIVESTKDPKARNLIEQQSTVIRELTNRIESLESHGSQTIERPKAGGVDEIHSLLDYKNLLALFQLFERAKIFDFNGRFAEVISRHFVQGNYKPYTPNTLWNKAAELRDDPESKVTLMELMVARLQKALEREKNAIGDEEFEKT